MIEFCYIKLTATSTRLQALLVTRELRWEVVVICLATAIIKLFASLRSLVIIPSRKITRTGTRLLSLITGINVIGYYTEFFTFFFCLEFIRVTKTTTINKLTALFSARIVIPSWVITFAGAIDFR